MSGLSSKYFLTTPIYYVNARPHIGHAYTTIVADVLARRHRLLGEDVFFLTGTDEHGQKIERSALAAGIAPQEFADQVSSAFEALWKRMGMTYDKFIRTTSEEHKRGVRKLFSRLLETGDIYLSTYTGQYCVSDEAFVDVAPGASCPDCGRITETLTEENFFFKLSAYQDRLLELINSNTLEIQPPSRRNEVLSFVAGGLKDLSISRTSFKWGIPVPGHDQHVIYVWLDALANYMTALGYGSEDETLFQRYWPADLHLVGKEIIRFHCVYWPAFLLAAGLPLPKQVVAHGWLLFEDSKMSKSKGNIVRTETILDAFGSVFKQQFPESTSVSQDLFASDVLRYFLLREIPFGQDGSFSFDALIARYNADLANGYGNLVSRALNMISTYFDGSIPAAAASSSALAANTGYPDPPATSGTNEIVASFSQLQSQSSGWFELRSFDAGTNISKLVAMVDGHLSAHVPWKLAKLTDPESRTKLVEVLYTAAEAIRLITALLYPVLPFATASVWRQLGLGDIEQAAAAGKLSQLEWGGLQHGTKLGALSPIFPRADKGLAQTMADMEAPPPLAAITTQNDAADPAVDDLSVAPVASASKAEADQLRSSTDPSAGPRTGMLPEVNPGSQVAASSAETTERPGTPSHTEAASGIFAGQPADSSPQITIEDFAKVELRVAQITVCERIPKADKLLRLEVDLGHEKRQILSGIAEWYTPEELLGRRIVVITNLAPRKMRGLESHGMLLAASSEAGKPALATFDGADQLPLGARLK